MKGCAVDQDVDPSESIVHELHRAVDIVFLSDVARHAERFEPALPECRSGLEHRFLVDIDERDAGTFSSEGSRERAAQTATPTGDDRRLLLEAHVTSAISPEPRRWSPRA